MASAWGQSWGAAWGSAWGGITTPSPGGGGGNARFVMGPRKRRKKIAAPAEQRSHDPAALESEDIALILLLS